ncbi:S-adenosyl-L-methionine-dependent methyltransferase [Aspergillus pseudoustus]|uniref:S-adenosyl-L-methionine-dependent methyltransferase n=1 Tax=Aspergillus pseudoustus TaxID=1810923 RepID=A0ABR4IK16_9EURO
MSQNIYDNPTFFASYNTLPRSQHGLPSAPEWPLLKSMVLVKQPDIKNARVLDLGCGYGWFCRWAAEEGLAAKVHGIDISEKMLERAREMTATDTERETATGIDSSLSLHLRINYVRADLETVVLEKEGYDVVYSSLTFHYVSDLARLLNTVYAALKRNGRFVFSVEHPIYTAPKEDKWHGDGTNDDGNDGLQSWLLNGYGDEGERNRNWLGDDVRKYHRTTQTYLTLLLRAGFVLREFVEWMPSDKDLEEHPEWAVERNRPAFLLIAVEKSV